MWRTNNAMRDGEYGGKSLFQFLLILSFSRAVKALKEGRPLGVCGRPRYLSEESECRVVERLQKCDAVGLSYSKRHFPALLLEEKFSGDGFALLAFLP